MNLRGTLIGTVATLISIYGVQAFFTQRSQTNLATTAQSSDYSERLNHLSYETATEGRLLQEDMEAGRWRAALDRIGPLEARRRAAGALAGWEAEPTVECLIGLGDVNGAMVVIDSAPEQVRQQHALTFDLARAMAYRLSVELALAHTEAARRAFSSVAAPPPLPRPQNQAQIVACVRLARAVENRMCDPVTEREAREVLKAYPGEPVASSLLAHALVNQNRSEEAHPYWKAAATLPGPDGEWAKAVCRNLYPDDPKYALPPSRLLKDVKGPMTPELQAEVDRQRAYHEQFRRKP